MSGGSKKPRVEGLPPGVSRDIFGPPNQPEPRPATPSVANGSNGQNGTNGQNGSGALPPVAPPPQPWPVNEGRWQEPPAPVFGVSASERLPAFIDPEPPRRRRLLPALVLLVVILAVLAYLVPAVLMSGSVLRGTRVAGVDIGGLTVTQAADKLRTELAAKMNKPVVVDIAGRKETIQADEAGLELDVVSTIGQAPSGFPGPVEVWKGLTGTTELQPKMTIDASQLSRTVEGLAESYDKKPRDGRVAFKNGQPVSSEPRDGVVIDRPDAVRVITEAFLRGRDSAVLTLRPAKPNTTPTALKQAEAAAKRAVAAPLTLKLGAKQAQLLPAVIAANLTFVSDDDGGLVPQFNAAAALTSVESKLVDAAQAPQDATYQIVNGKPVLVPAHRGRGIDAKQLARDVAKVVSGNGARIIPVTLSVVPPKVTTEEVTGLGIKTNIAEFTTTFDCCLPRVTNIQRMAAQVDGHLVKPGETFSLNDVVGERTVEGGYVQAGQIVGGRMVPIIGGGVSQFATTMYNAAFFGGFDDVSHTPMDYHAARYPAGRDAALLYPDLDLKWRNDSDYGVLIKTVSTGTSVSVQLWSTKRYDKIEAVESEKRDFTPFRRETSSAPGCMATVGEQGFTIDVTRVFFKDGKEVKRDKKLTTKYRPQAQTTCATSN
ncbi:VanW family protein [Nonomuraea aurantiaca]|uniref:VanW family protein n=1 Tax=Nonomuraea aurantiaca TaxID=2878562 RepID=UPI001CDA3B23|nr:VanW family protein [Nonomuraea aurantiaca]MCA2222979.1 VanW family protein [Nonomuraea aurantiaca]